MFYWEIASGMQSLLMTYQKHINILSTAPSRAACYRKAKTNGIWLVDADGFENCQKEHSMCGEHSMKHYYDCVLSLALCLSRPFSKLSDRVENATTNLFGMVLISGHFAKGQDLGTHRLVSVICHLAI